MLSRAVLTALGSAMAGRYAGRPESYGGSRIFQKLWTRVEELAIKIFHCEFATVLPVSGHIAGMMTLDSVRQKNDSLATLSVANGGYKGYSTGHIPEVLGMKVSHLPFDVDSWNVNLEASLDYLEREKPSIVMLGATVFLFPHPVREMAKVVHSYGGKLIYDGSHVLGLIAGNHFQDPLEEGADVLLGSTHKTLFGPQGGLILSNDKKIATKIEDRALYRFIDNFHLNRVASLGIAFEEVKAHGRSYSGKVIQNSKTLAVALSKAGIPVVGREKGFTGSHQVFLNYGNEGAEIRDTLETNGIISDSRVRLGTNEVTRRGMGSREMIEISALITQTLSEPNSPIVRKRVRKLLSPYRKLLYTLKS